MVITASGLDLSDMRDAADFWLASMNECEAWEAVRLECKAEEDARKQKP